MFYACTIEIPGPAWLSYYTRKAETQQEAEQLFNNFCNILNAKVVEVWETTEADWLDLMLHDKELL